MQGHEDDMRFSGRGDQVSICHDFAWDSTLVCESLELYVKFYTFSGVLKGSLFKIDNKEASGLI